MNGVSACLAVSLAVGGCQRSAQPPAVNFTAATSLQAIPLGPPPGADAVVAVSNPFEGDAAAIARGRALFVSMNCVYCHGAGGVGLMGPPLNAPGWRYGGAPAQIYNSIHDGRPQGMPAWGHALPPEEIWRIVAYLETLSRPSNPSSAGAQVAGQNAGDTAETARRAANAEVDR